MILVLLNWKTFGTHSRYTKSILGDYRETTRTKPSNELCERLMTRRREVGDMP